MRRGRPPRPTVLAAGDLRLDPASRRVWRGEEEVALTARETALLEYLLGHPGTVVSKRDILGNVWDEDFEGEEPETAAATTGSAEGGEESIDDGGGDEE